MITAIPSIAITVGANRIVQGVAIPHPVGSPSEENYEAEMEVRIEILERALRAICTPIAEQTVFSKGKKESETGEKGPGEE